MRDSSRK